jgi:hypothetical protein
MNDTFIYFSLYAHLFVHVSLYADLTRHVGFEVLTAVSTLCSPAKRLFKLGK